VGPNVLIPRPETEILVETALSYAEKMDRPAIVDVGAGCGAIAVSLSKLLRNHPKIYATDISERALKIAKQNAERLGAEIQFICCDVLSGIDLCVDIILSNPPYVQTEDIPRYEPKIALDGGADGLSLYPKIMEEARRLLKERGLLLLEVGFGQCSKVVEMAERYGFFTKIAKDLAGIERVIIASWTR
jgi:release factor glutamine methyltransferase